MQPTVTDTSLARLFALDKREVTLTPELLAGDPHLVVEVRALLERAATVDPNKYDGKFSCLAQSICSRLGKIEGLAQPFLPQVADMLTSSDWWFRTNAAKILDFCGADSRPYLNAIIDFTNNSTKQVDGKATHDPRAVSHAASAIAAICMKFPDEITNSMEFFIYAMKAGAEHWQIGDEPAELLLKIAQTHSRYITPYRERIASVYDWLPTLNDPSAEDMVPDFKKIRTRVKECLGEILEIIRE